MPSKIQIHTDRALKPAGPYSQGIIYGDLVFTAQIGLDPATDKIVGPDIESQTRQTLQNIAAILEAKRLPLDVLVEIECIARR